MGTLGTKDVYIRGLTQEAGGLHECNGRKCTEMNLFSRLSRFSRRHAIFQKNLEPVISVKKAVISKRKFYNTQRMSR